MQSKSNVILDINIFFSMVKTQFRRIVKVCRSDNGSKFLNVVVNDFFFMVLECCIISVALIHHNIMV